MSSRKVRLFWFILIVGFLICNGLANVSSVLHNPFFDIVYLIFALPLLLIVTTGLGIVLALAIHYVWYGKLPDWWNK